MTTEADRSIYAAANTWFVTHPGAAGTFAPTLNMLYLWPTELAADMRIDTLKLEVTAAATAGGILRMGFYAAAAGGLPGALLLDCGSIDVTSTGLKDIAFAATRLPRGRVYQAAVAQVAASGFRSVTGWRPQYPIPAAGFYAGIDAISYGISGTTGALPSTAGAPTTIGGSLPIRTFIKTAA